MKVPIIPPMSCWNKLLINHIATEGLILKSYTETKFIEKTMSGLLPDCGTKKHLKNDLKNSLYAVKKLHLSSVFGSC